MIDIFKHYIYKRAERCIFSVTRISQTVPADLAYCHLPTCLEPIQMLVNKKTCFFGNSAFRNTDIFSEYNCSNNCYLNVIWTVLAIPLPQLLANTVETPSVKFHSKDNVFGEALITKILRISTRRTYPFLFLNFQSYIYQQKLQPKGWLHYAKRPGYRLMIFSVI